MFHISRTYTVSHEYSIKKIESQIRPKKAAKFITRLRVTLSRCIDKTYCGTQRAELSREQLDDKHGRPASRPAGRLIPFRKEV